jgi:hypothetical protein
MLGRFQRSGTLGILLAVALLFGCASSTVRSVKTAPLLSGDSQIPEELLLDVGVRLFDPGVEQLKEDELLTSASMPKLLVDSLAKSGHWGAVRLAPAGTGVSDVTVDGKIFESTGEKLVLEITPSDASGTDWYTRRYEQKASKYNYDKPLTPGADPFQDIYNRIANDMAVYRARIDDQQARRLRQISELRFAESFSPEAFGGYIEKDSQGKYTLARLPAEGDPMLDRIRRIRERDNLFVDTLQDYYGNFSSQMSAPYHDWRKESYVETIQYKELKRQATMRTVTGVAAVLGGILASTQTNNTERNERGERRRSSNTAAQAATVAGVLGGAALIKSGIGKRAEAKMHAETLKELGGSLSADINPQVIELDDRSITLTGTVQDQYAQWREILHGIYKSEAGSI